MKTKTSFRSRFLALALGAGIFCLGMSALAAPGDRSPEGAWTQIEPSALDRGRSGGAIAGVRPERFAAFELDPSALQAALRRAPMEFSAEARDARSRLVASLPSPEGGFERFELVESPVAERPLLDWLASQGYPMRTYQGRSLDTPSTTIRLDLGGPDGFHGRVLSPAGEYWIDPYWKGGAQSLYASYRREDLSPSEAYLNCGAAESLGSSTLGGAEAFRAGPNLRTYRLAMAATGGYTAFHSLPGAPSQAAGQAAVVTAVNRVNQVYERDLGVRLVLVANNMDIVFTDAATDPYTDGNVSAMLGENQTTCDAVIGSANYDVGHVVGAAGNSGLATVGSVCSGALKARGATSLVPPTGDLFHLDFIAHELGHQFGANHTWSGDGGTCDAGSHHSATAHEPGSGSTIMAYTGNCGPSNNLQAQGDAMFSSVSIAEMGAFIAATATCNGTVATANANDPMVSAGPDFTIPARTSFELIATGSDADGDSPTYSWEQIDANGPQAVPGTDTGANPLFRVFLPRSSPSRTFPDPAAGPSVGETLPTTNRTLNMRVQARDNNAETGRTAFDDMVLTVVDTGAPFEVTFPNGGEIFTPGDSLTVTWNVAGTASAPINAALVNIELSEDGGQTYPITLAANTPNDGSQTVVLFGAGSYNSRIRVKASGNAFLDYSDQDFIVTFDTIMSYDDQEGPAPIPDFGGGCLTRTFNVPDDLIVSDLNVGFSADHPFRSDLRVRLTSPTGTQATLIASGNGDNDNNYDLLLDDASANPIDDNDADDTAAPFYDRTAMPSEALSAFNNQSAMGVWTLEICDQFGTDAGTFNRARLVISQQGNDMSPPTASSIGLADPSPTNASTVSWNVLFNEFVTGVDAGDFALASTGTASGTITGFSGMGNAYTVTATGVSGDGTLGLNLVDDNSIMDASGNLLGGAAAGDGNFSGQAYAIDNMAPTLAISSSESSPTGLNPIPATFTFSEPVTGFDLSDIVVGNGVASNLMGSGAVYTADISPPGDGTVTIDVAMGAAMDAAGNSSAAAPQFSIDYNGGDTVPPAVSAIDRADPSPSNAAMVSWTATFSEPVTGVDAGDFALVPTGTAAGTVTGVSGSGDTWTVAVSGVAGDGILRLNLADDDSIMDLAGNPLGGTGAGNGDFMGQFYIVDHTPPTVAISSAASSTTSEAPIPVAFAFSQSVSGFDLSDIVVGNGSASNLMGSGDAYTADLTPAADGPVTVDVAMGAAMDFAGNPSDAATQFSITFIAGGNGPVDNAGDADDGNFSPGEFTLREALRIASPGATITFAASLDGATINLDSSLTADKPLSIDASSLGTGLTIQPNPGRAFANRRHLFVNAGEGMTVNLVGPMTFQNGAAEGGDGDDTDDSGGGGGGAGLGGSIFAYSGNLNVANVSFSGNRAEGGDGGDAAALNTIENRGGGGGIGGDATPTSGGAGNPVTAGGGGSNGSNGFGNPGQPGAPGAGGGGGGTEEDGGAGGFGGGGGGGGTDLLLEGGGDGGAGGFGGGGGGGGSKFNLEMMPGGAGGPGGLHGGAGGAGFSGSNPTGGAGGGGGGAGLGGAIFVNAPGALTLTGCSFSGNMALRGTGGAALDIVRPGQPGSDGQGKGGAIYIADGGSLADGGGNSFATNAADDDAMAPGMDDDDIYYQGVVAPLSCVVTTLLDEDDGGLGLGAGDSLRECLSAVGNGGSVSFMAGLSGTIAQTGPRMAIAKDVAVQGPGADAVAVEGLSGGGDRIFQIDGGAVSISGLGIANAAFSGPGAAIGVMAGSLSLGACAVTGHASAGDGGAIANFAALSIDSCELSGNASMGGGGALFSSGSLSVANSTISGNVSAGDGGGALVSGGAAALSNCSVADNMATGSGSSGGGVAIAGGMAAIDNSIVADNFAGSGSDPDASGPFASGGFNLIGDSAGSTGFGAGDLLDMDPMLGALADNGGPTRTHALLAGSPALDAGDPSSTLALDQRGQPRMQDNGGGMANDIGAFEAGAGTALDAPPTAACMDITVQLSMAGMVSVAAADVDDGSSDAEGAVTLSISNDGGMNFFPSVSFMAGDEGPNAVVLRAADSAGQTSECMATVTVQAAPPDAPPTAVCMNIAVQLSMAGMVSVAAADVDAGSSDAEGAVTLSISSDGGMNFFPSVSFMAGDEGPNAVVLRATDSMGQTGECMATVTVQPAPLLAPATPVNKISGTQGDPLSPTGGLDPKPSRYAAFGSSAATFAMGGGVDLVAIGSPSAQMVWLLVLEDGALVSQTRFGAFGEGNFPADVVQKGSGFGASVAWLSDSLLAVGAPADDANGTNRGAVWLVPVDPLDLEFPVAGAPSRMGDGDAGLSLADNANFGASLSALDTGGDGSADLLAAGAPGASAAAPSGTVWLMSVSGGSLMAAGNVAAPGSSASLSVYFGASAAWLGDIDADPSTLEIAVGAPWHQGASYGAKRGAAFVLSLEAANLGNVAGFSLFGADGLGGFPQGGIDTYDLFGSSLAFLGDVDGDGLPDLAAGAPGDDDGQLGGGAAWIVSLDPSSLAVSGVVDKVSAAVPGFGAGGAFGPVGRLDAFGSSLAPLSPSGAGSARFLSGAPGDDDGNSAAGAAWVVGFEGGSTRQAAR